MILKNEISSVAAVVPTAVALLLAVVFVGLTLFIAFWRKCRAKKIRKRARRRHGKFDSAWIWAAVLFFGFAAYIVFLGKRY